MRPRGRPLLEIQDIIIERQDQGTFCGVLTFRHRHEEQALTWSFQWGESQKVVLMLYPARPTTADTGVIQSHYRELADAILGEVFRRA